MSREIEFRDALREAMSEEMRRDQRVFLLGEEVAQYNGAYKVSKGMLDEFGERRIIDTPISESGFAGMAIGAAMRGLRPICEFMSWSFSLVAADPILNNAPKMLYMSGGQFGCPIVFRGNDGAGGQLGSTHSWCVEGLYSNVPGLKMAIPLNPYDAKGLLKTAIRDDDPVFFLESERMLGDTGDVPEEEYLIPFGQAKIRREGSRLHHRELRSPRALLHGSSGGAREGGHRVRGHRRTHHSSARHRRPSSGRCARRTTAWSWTSPGPSPRWGRRSQRRCTSTASTTSTTTSAACTRDDVPAPYAMNLEQEMLPNARRIAECVRSTTYNA